MKQNVFYIKLQELERRLHYLLLACRHLQTAAYPHLITELGTRLDRFASPANYLCGPKRSAAGCGV